MIMSKVTPPTPQSHWPARNRLADELELICDKLMAEAYFAPDKDGGTQLVVPVSSATSKVFEKVRWLRGHVQFRQSYEGEWKFPKRPTPNPPSKMWKL